MTSPKKTKSAFMDAAEQELIDKARQAVTSCNWSLGECAAQWTDRYARGRTDLDFAELVGNDTQPGHVGRCRRVWATFCVPDGLESVRTRWPWLSWSHFDKARSFGEHAIEALDWAQVNDAPIRGMQAWACETWPELRTSQTLFEQAEQQEVATLDAQAEETKQPVTMHVPEPCLVHADDMEHSEPSAIRCESEKPPETDYPRAVKRVLYTFAKTIEAFKSGMFQQADADQQSELLEQTENFRRWLTGDEATAPERGDALIFLPRLQWCSQFCNAKFIAGAPKHLRMLIQSAVDDLAGVMAKYRQ